MCNCNNVKITGIQVCAEYQENWYSHIVCYSCQLILGICRLLKQSEEKQLDWLPVCQPNLQPHDKDALINYWKNYFITLRFYYIETICVYYEIIKIYH